MKRPIHLCARPFSEFMWLPSSTTLEQVMDQLETLFQLESSTYQRNDYMALYYSNNNNNNNTRSRHPAMNERTRQSMVELLYEIGDYCHFRRETVSYAVWNLMDRYLSSSQQSPLMEFTTADYQLVASTSLFIAVKVLEPVSMDVQSLADLSQGAFSADDILDMERTILATLQWRIAHGPTPIQFVQLYLSILQMDGRVLAESEVFDMLFEHAQYQVELAVMDYKLVQSKPSEIALAALWNALECNLHDGGVIVQQWQQQLVQQIATLPPSLHDKLPSLQLQLCKLQYAAEQSQQRAEQPPLLPSTTTTEVERDEPRNPTDDCYYDCNDDEDHTEAEYDEEAALAMFPSPVSVTLHPMSARHYSAAKDAVMLAQDDPECFSLGFSLLRRFFFFALASPSG
ncbi:diatom-specific cyclin [Seminavis robusta]|uniref:Diatom-specific cyclin n=1 Tax=Seminavis robusta TaxID=568900 RepID=A0A9N8HNQ0_9STRA|nr:diatom-specific cyclin [Seminavis robusta]|eukprot:Sro1015_g231520.1 diatom-specific cyclin (400) ;mRNA; r:16101-17300